MRLQRISGWSLAVGCLLAAVTLLPMAAIHGQEKTKTGRIHGKIVYPDGKPFVGVNVRLGDQLWKPPPGMTCCRNSCATSKTATPTASRRCLVLLPCPFVGREIG